jgi:2-polyprenyl-6-methoxyphenol hydroxylase-like FAD-dependent oxidoreductase
MTSNVKRVLIVGGGFSGMSAASELARQDVAVDLVEIDSGWRSYGAGISLNGGIFRVMDRLGILEDFKTVGAMTDGVEMRGPDDQVLARLPTPSLQEGATGTGGVMRPVLAGLLADRVRASNVNVRLGQSFTAIDDGPDACRVSFTDGSAADYDLVVGADGLYSSVRAALWPEAPEPRYISQAVWRAVVPRPEHLPTVTMWLGPKLKAGINHVSATHSYIFLTEDRPSNDHVPSDTHVAMLKDLLSRFPSPTLKAIAAELNESHQVVFRPLEQLLLPRPWSKGRVVLMGDAAHATTPHLAAGAMIGMEDAIVLSEALSGAAGLRQALEAFEERRWERCRMVVENSGRLAEIEQGHGTPDEHRQLMGASLGALAQPI